MHAQTEPQTNPFLSSSAFTWAGSICDGSSTGISIDSNPHFLNCGNSFVLSFVKGEVNKNVLIPNLIVLGDVMRRLHRCEVPNDHFAGAVPSGAISLLNQKSPRTTALRGWVVRANSHKAKLRDVARRREV